MNPSTRDGIARLCHEANRAYCISIGDESQLPFDKAPHWQQESARLGVQLHHDNRKADASDSHVSWMKEKLDSGWVHGDTKDESLKTHPCLVPFAELPQEQQIKDHIFRSVCHAQFSVQGL